MKNNDTVKNIAVGFGSQLIIIAMSFALPRLTIVSYGSDTNGLTSTITQIFTYLALLEAGIGSAARNALFKSVSEDNKGETSYWISIARLYYRRVSVYYLLALFIMAFTVPFAIKTEVSYFTIVIYILIEGIANVVSFYYISIWTSFLSVSGKIYITSTITLGVRIFGYITRFVVVLTGLNIAFMQVGYFLAVFVQLIIYYHYMKKHYPWIDYNCADKHSKLPDRNVYILTEIAWTIFSSTDLIVLSMFVSTSMASVYSVYNMVFSALNVLLNALYSSINYHLGLAYFEDIEKYKKLHDLYNSIFIGLMTMLMCVAYWLTLPFVSLYTEGVTDIDYMYKWLPLLFCLVQLLSWTRYVGGNISGIAGYAKPTSLISLAEAIVNIVLSIVLVPTLGIMGVLLATVVALPTKVIYVNWLADKRVMLRSCKKTITIISVNYIIFAATIFLREVIHFNISNVTSFVTMGVALTMGYSVIIFGANCLANRYLLIPIKKAFRRKVNG